MLLGSRLCVTLGELVHASLVLINSLPDGFVHIPAILQIQSGRVKAAVHNSPQHETQGMASTFGPDSVD